jgi:hypothetical protein
MTSHRTLDALDPDNFTDASPDPARDADLAALCDTLRGLGVNRIVLRYDGCGDSGSIQEVEYEPESFRPTRELEDKLYEVAESYCPDGYENNDGGDGCLTVHVTEGLAELEHTDRFEDTEDMDVATAALPEALRERLTRLGVTAVTANFDGYGDSGQIEALAAEPPGVILDRQLSDELEDYLFGLLPGGWENNEGGYGDFAVDVAGGRVQASAYWRVEKDSETVTTRWKWRR